MRNPNPYNYNLPVRPDMFFGRHREVETLQFHLTSEPGDSFAVIGGRRMGKTSLLEALSRTLELMGTDPAGGLLPIIIFLDLVGHGFASVSAFFSVVLDQTQEMLVELLSLPKATTTITDAGPPAPPFGRSLVSWNQTVMAKRGRRLRLVLLLDECEQIVEQPWTSDLYGALRYLLVGSSTRSLFKVVMAGSHRFLTQVRQKGSPLRNVLKYHKLRVLDTQAIQDLTAQPSGGIVSEEVTRAVGNLSGGHPFLVQYLMHNLWERGLEEATPDSAVQIAGGFCLERNDFHDWASTLGDSGLRTYGALVRNRKTLTKDQIGATLCLPPSDVSRGLDALCYHGLVVQVIDGAGYHYRIAGSMFRDWFVEVRAMGDGDEDDRDNGSEEEERMLTWLHISDLHFRVSEDYEENIVLQALLRDIDRRICDEGLQPDFVIVTGDIAFSSDPKEYELASKFFDALLGTTHLSKERLFLIPGNHDVDRSAISDFDLGADKLNCANIVNRFLSDEEGAVRRRTSLFERFQNYQRFINEYLAGSLYFDSRNYFYAKRIELAGHCVAILGLNSAWLAGSDEDRNRLLVGERQVRDALAAAQDADLFLAAMHHPFDWLQDFDSKRVRRLLSEKCDFILHGHMHDVGLFQQRNPDTEAFTIAAGACYATREYPNSYSFVRLDLAAGEGLVYLRRYSYEGDFWAKDTLTYQNVPDGVYQFALPTRLRVRGGSQTTNMSIAVDNKPATMPIDASHTPTTINEGSSNLLNARKGAQGNSEQNRQVASDPYDLAASRSLIRDAFSAKELRRFCEERSLFAPMLSRFPSDLVLEDMIDVIIEYCQKHMLFAELLAEIQEVKPRQYERYQAQLYPGDRGAVGFSDEGTGSVRDVEEKKGVTGDMKMTVDFPCSDVDSLDLFQAIQHAFGPEDFEVLCFALGTSSAELKGDVLRVKMLSLIEWHQQRGTYAKLVEKVLHERPRLRETLCGK